MLLELTPPVCAEGNGVPEKTDGSKEVGGAHSSEDIGDNITPEERRGSAMENIFEERSILLLAMLPTKE